MWVMPFDFRALAPLQGYGFDSSQYQAGADCDRSDSGNGECYLNFPWAFSVADAIAYGQFIPAAAPPIPPEDELVLQVEDLSSESRDTESSGSYDGDSASHAHASKYRQEGLRVVRIRVVGPSHMALVIRDGSGGVVEGWSLTETLPPPRHEGVRYVMINSGSCGADTKGG